MFDDCYSLISRAGFKIKGVDQNGNIVCEEVDLTNIPEVEAKMSNNVLQMFDGVQKNVFSFDFDMNFFPTIRHISYCDKPGKEMVVVVFNDNTKVIKRPVDGDVFDINIGVALAIAEKIYGSKSQFHKEIKRKTVVKKEK